MAKFCMYCGKPLQPMDKFCMGCGKPVESGEAQGGFAIPGPNADVSPSGMPVTPQGQASGFFGSAPMPSDAFQQSIPQGGPGPATVLDGGFVPPAVKPDSIPAWSSVMENVPMRESDTDTAQTEVWQVHVEKSPNHADPFVMQVPRDEAVAQGDIPKLKSVSYDPGEEEDESPTIVAQFLQPEDDEDSSPTIVVAREKCVLTRQDGGERIELLVPCIVGRGKASDKRFTGNQAISRRHAKFVKENGEYLVEDLDSTNGTYVNGAEVAQGTRVPLQDGAVVRLGTEDFTFTVESV